jgi:hypothetical protein
MGERMENIGRVGLVGRLHGVPMRGAQPDAPTRESPWWGGLGASAGRERRPEGRRPEASRPDGRWRSRPRLVGRRGGGLAAGLVGGLLGALLGGFIGPAPAGAQTDRTLTYAQSVAVTAMDTAGPTIGTVYPAGYEGMFLIYDNLVRFTEKMAIEPQLATEWATSADGRTWTFKLRRGATFHDGTPVNADAVVFHVER